MVTAAEIVNKLLTEQEQTNAELMELKPMVGKTVKNAIAVRMDITTRTIETYLKGEGRDAQLAAKMLTAVKEELLNIELTAGE